MNPPLQTPKQEKISRFFKQKSAKAMLVRAKGDTLKEEPDRRGEEPKTPKQFM